MGGGQGEGGGGGGGGGVCVEGVRGVRPTRGAVPLARKGIPLPLLTLSGWKHAKQAGGECVCHPDPTSPPVPTLHALPGVVLHCRPRGMATVRRYPALCCPPHLASLTFS